MASIADKVKVTGSSIELNHSLTNVDFAYFSYINEKNGVTINEELQINTDEGVVSLNRREIGSLVKVLEAVGVI